MFEHSSQISRPLIWNPRNRGSVCDSGRICERFLVWRNSEQGEPERELCKNSYAIDPNILKELLFDVAKTRAEIKKAIHAKNIARAIAKKANDAVEGAIKETKSKAEIKKLELIAQEAKRTSDMARNTVSDLLRLTDPAVFLKSKKEGEAAEFLHGLRPECGHFLAEAFFIYETLKEPLDTKDDFKNLIATCITESPRPEKTASFLVVGQMYAHEASGSDEPFIMRDEATLTKLIMDANKNPDDKGVFKMNLEKLMNDAPETAHHVFMEFEQATERFSVAA